MNTSASTIMAQFPEEYKTPEGELTGYYWKSLSRAEKTVFVYGFEFGYVSAKPENKLAQEQAKKSCLDQLVTPTPKQKFDCIMKSFEAKTDEYKRWNEAYPLDSGTYGDTVDATDRFFEEPENRVMPITVAWSITKLKMEGRKQSEVDIYMDSFREAFIRGPRKLCESGWGMTETRCRKLGTTLKTPSAK